MIKEPAMVTHCKRHHRLSRGSRAGAAGGLCRTRRDEERKQQYLFFAVNGMPEQDLTAGSRAKFSAQQIMLQHISSHMLVDLH